MLTNEELAKLKKDIEEENLTLSDDGEHGGIYDPDTVLSWLRSLNEDRERLLKHILEISK